MRIQKYLSEQKICSRREAERYIKMGLIKLNGTVVRDLGHQINPEIDKIEVLPLPKSEAMKIMTIAVNKPRNIVCSRNSSEGSTIFELLPQFKHLNVVGRLDKSSEGLILLSNDGAITSSITNDKHVIEKEYEVHTRETIRPNHLDKMKNGMVLEDGPTLPAKVTQINQNLFKIILKEGRKHQIRRMCAMVNLTIIQLKRIRIGNLRLDKLPQGQFRQLKLFEVQNIKTLAK